MSNSTAVAATIGVGALGVLAYYGFQKINSETDEKSLYNEMDNLETNESKNDENDLQTKAKDEVKKVIDNVTNSWSGFWRNEYNDIKVENENTESE